MPHFLNTQANELINWFTTSIHARTQLAVLLRKLIQSTGHELQKVDFPGNDDAERPGWDGFLETSSSNAWIPDGISGWEFGVTESITKKADGDFEKVLERLTTLKEEILRLFLSLRDAGKAKSIGSRR